MPDLRPRAWALSTRELSGPKPTSMSFTIQGACLNERKLVEPFTLEVTYYVDQSILRPESISPYVKSFEREEWDFESLVQAIVQDVRGQTDAPRAFARISYKMFGHLDMATFAEAHRPEPEPAAEAPADVPA